MRALLDRTPGWPTLAAAAALVAFMLISAVAPLASAVVAGLSRAQRITPLLALLTAALIAAGTVAVVVRLARLTRPVSADQLGLCGPRSAVRALVFALAAGAALAVLTALWSFVADVRGALPVPPELDPRSAVARAYGLGLSEPVAFGPGLVASALARCVLPVVAGEVLLRGFAFPAIARRHGPLVAGAVVAGLFGGLTTLVSAPGIAVPSMVLGGLLCALYVSTGSLLPGMAVGAAAAAIALGVACALPLAGVAVLAIGCPVVATGLASLVAARRPLPAAARPQPGFQRGAA